MYNYRKGYGLTPRTFGGMIEDMNKFFYDDNWSNTTAPVNIKETENGYELHLVAPGLKKEDFKINVDDNVLKISFEHKEENKSEGDKWLRNEYRFRSFKRNFTLNENINAEGITARYNDGILNVMLPKKEATEKTTKDITVA
ncbi:MAG TPA: Hsp20/alpha crystallin family protein [Flavipsychrobacter sp.]|nr:Hsp20/alpha crystallin family protein [Chitinophagales bacterium]HLO70088.1 Hsp20/alpha crystallin family protein [Flavipsychrobacter sp.]